MPNGIQPVQDIFGLGRLAQSIRLGRQEERDKRTAGLQQRGLELGIQEKEAGLAALQKQQAIKQGVTDAISANPDINPDRAAFEFLRQNDPDQARQFSDRAFGRAKDILALGGPEAATSFIKDSLGVDIPITNQTESTFTVDLGDKVQILDKASGDLIREEKKTTKPTALIQNLEAAGLKQGTPAFNQALLSNLQKSGTTQRIEISPDGGIKIIEEPSLPQQKFEAKQKEAGEAAKKRADQALSQADTVIKKVDQSLEEIGLFTAGFLGAPLGLVPGTPAKDLRANIETIKANLAFNALNALREASKTGGALGAVSERELSLLESQISSLDPAQSPEQIKRNLNEVRASFEDIKEKSKQRKAEETETGDNVKVLNFDSQGNLIQ